MIEFESFLMGLPIGAGLVLVDCLFFHGRYVAVPVASWLGFDLRGRL